MNKKSHEFPRISYSIASIEAPIITGAKTDLGRASRKSLSSEQQIKPNSLTIFIIEGHLIGPQFLTI